MRELRAAVDSRATFVSFCAFYATDICRVCITFHDKKLPTCIITSFRKLVLRRDVINVEVIYHPRSECHTDGFVLYFA
jgi:hypothetical protein